MRDILVRAYQSFEESFDGSKVLAIFQKLKPCLQNLAELAQGLAVAPPVLRRKLNIEEAEFDAVALERERGQRDLVLGKRVRADSLPQVDRVLRRERFEHEATAQSQVPYLYSSGFPNPNRNDMYAPNSPDS